MKDMAAVILIHGLDGNSAAFDLLNKQLQQNYRVIAYDVRGHGKSSRQIHIT